MFMKLYCNQNMNVLCVNTIRKLFTVCNTNVYSWIIIYIKYGTQCMWWTQYSLYSFRSLTHSHSLTLTHSLTHSLHSLHSLRPLTQTTHCAHADHSHSLTHPPHSLVHSLNSLRPLTRTTYYTHFHSATLARAHLTSLPAFLAWSRDFILFSRCSCSGAR